MNAYVNNYDYLLSEAVWENHDLSEEGPNISYFSNYYIKFITQISKAVITEE